VPVERRVAELESSLAQVRLDPAENLSLLAPLLDIPLPQDRAPALAPEELRRRQLAALTNWVMAAAKVQPVVLAVEDLHWADPTTLDVLRGIAERGALAPLFVVATTRPEFRLPGACARITAPSRWRRSIARRCATWWPSSRRATRCRGRWSRTWPRAPVVYRCSSKK
jgi:hypothetical protein